MKRLSLLAPFFALALTASGKVTETDWATIEAPDTWAAGRELRVKVTPKAGIPEGMMVGSHLHWMKTGRTWGGFLSFQNPKAAEPGTSIEFRHTPAMKDAMGTIDALAFLAPDGDFAKKVKEGHCEVVVESAEAAPASTPASASSLKQRDLDWAVIETSATWSEGQPFVVKVTPKAGIPAGMQVACDLHWMKKDGWGGVMGCWTPPQDAVPAKTVAFTLNPKVPVGLDRIDALVFLAPNADFNKRVKDSHGDVKYVAAAAGADASSKTTAVGTIVNEQDWATIEVPAKWAPGSPLVVKVTPKADVPAGMQVACDLHWMKKDGWGGVMGCWTPAQDAVAGKSLVFTKKPNQPEGLDHIDAFVFLAPNGDFNKKVKDAHTTVALDREAVPAEPPYAPMPAGITFKKSALWIDRTSTQETGPARKGDKVTATVKYRLDPSETWGDKPTQIEIVPLGPWIDNPDGQINKGRQHVFYHGLWSLKKEIQPGEGEATFEWTIGQTSRYNGHFFLAKFKRPDGKDWPWDSRGGSLAIARENQGLILEGASQGGIFFGDATPAVDVVWSPKAAPGAKQAKMTVKNVAGQVVLEREVSVDPAKKNERIEIPGIPERGCFSVTLDVPDVGSDYAFVATAPVFTRRGSAPTPFGCTDVNSPECSELAAKLGFSYVRHFTGWSGLEPQRGRYRFDGIGRTIDANVAAGLRPWISLQGAPSWALPQGMFGFGFEPAPVDMQAWAGVVTAVSRRFKGKLYGWEWLNEIVPGGKCEDPVATYLEMCRQGTAAAKAVDPNLEIQLAGGLWPHNFRIDLLNAGVGRLIDVLPVHYANYSSVDEAWRDLRARGLDKVGVIDNESASGMSVWNMNAEQTLAMSVNQCLHVMTRWPDVLCAGATRVVYFGGQPNAAGNWSYLLDARTPRPVAVTLAVVQGKLAYAKPVGKFFLGEAEVWLFENTGGSSVVFLRVAGKEGVAIDLPARGALKTTDYQGNEKTVRGAVVAGDMPVIVEGADLDALKMCVVASAGRSSVPAPVPQHVVDLGDAMKVPVRVRNPYAAAKTFALASSAFGWGSAQSVKVALEPGEEKFVEMTFVCNAGAKVPPTTDLKLVVAADGLPTVEKPFVLYATDGASMGNLLQNGDFENGKSGWNGLGSVESDSDDAANHVFKLAGTGNWVQAGQTLQVPVPGQTYLYTAWAWSKNMDAGSNLIIEDQKGAKQNLYMPNVFNTGAQGTRYWRYFAKQVATKADVRSIFFQPVGRGASGAWTLYDNIQVTLYRGTDYVGFAGKGDAAKGSPIPLLCDNQIKADAGYTWAPKNLAGKASFGWDEQDLAFDLVVEDDAAVWTPATSESGLETLRGDAIALTLFPRMGVDGPENDQIRWYISKASPGGGSGAVTVFRPAKYSCGAKSGQLVKDSSVYDVAISREGSRTRYRVKIPWAEIPGFTPAKGATFGCTLELFDADTQGGPQGRMSWGGGLREAPGDCGLVTLLP